MDAHDALTEPDGLASAELRKLSNLDRFTLDLQELVLEQVLGGQAQTLLDETLACLDELAGPDRGLVEALGSGILRTQGRAYAPSWPTPSGAHPSRRSTPSSSSCGVTSTRR